MKMIKAVYVIAITVLTIVHADLSVYCTLNANPDQFKRHADFAFYQ